MRNREAFQVHEIKMWQTIKLRVLAGGGWEGGTKAEDLAYQSGTDGKLQVFYQKATKFCQSARAL